MGIKTIKGILPTKDEAITGKNYLDETEIYRMHLLSEQFLLYAESTALMGKKMTMKGLHQQLDKLLELNGYPVFDGYKDYLKDRALEHAIKEYEIFLEIKKLEHIVPRQLSWPNRIASPNNQTSWGNHPSHQIQFQF